MQTAIESEQISVPLWQRLLIGRRPKRTLIRALVLVCMAWVTFTFILLPIRITGISMEPTYHDRQVNFINRLAYLRSKPQRGDVVGVKIGANTAGNHILYLKRIIGLPGETVAIHNGTVYIDNEPLNEPYLRFRAAWEKADVKLDADKYYVIGDNRGMAIEQHEFGRADARQILGKVIR